MTEFKLTRRADAPILRRPQQAEIDIAALEAARVVVQVRYGEITRTQFQARVQVTVAEAIKKLLDSV